MFPSVEIYDQTRAARALLDRFLVVAYNDARAVWNDNRETLGPVYEYPEVSSCRRLIYQCSSKNRKLAIAQQEHKPYVARCLSCHGTDLQFRG